MTLPEEARASSTLDLVPNADGHELDWTPKGAGDHYVEVDDGNGSHDDDTTYISETSGNQEDYWNLVDHTSESGTITNVRLSLRVKHDGGAGGEEFAYTMADQWNAEYVSGDTATDTTWTTYTSDYALHPVDDVAWNWTAIDNLQIGIKSRAIGGYTGTGMCTSGWITITYSAGAPDITDFYWTGNGDNYEWEDEENWKGLDGGTWYTPGVGDYPKSNLDTASFNESSSSLYLQDGANSVITLGALTTTTGFTGTITFSVDLILDDAGGQNGSFNHKAVATIDVNTSNEGISADGNFYAYDTGTFTERSGTVTLGGATTQQIRVQDSNKLYELTLANSGTIAELYDNLTLYKVTIPTDTTLKADAATRGYELWMNFSDTAGSGMDIASAGTLDFDGSSAGRGANISTAQASPPPTNYWSADVTTGDMTYNLDYSTLTYGRYAASGGTWNVQDCTFDNFKTDAYTVLVESGGTITNFNDNTLSNSAYGFNSYVAHSSFSNVVINSMSTTDIKAEDILLEFVDSNFDVTKVDLATTGDAVSDNNNDVSNDYYIFATDLLKSSLTVDFASGDAITLQMGKFMLDEAGAAKSVKFLSGTTFQIGQDAPTGARTLTFDDSAGAGFLTASAGTLVGSGTGSWQMTITSAATPPTDFWNGDMSTGDPTVTLDYTTLSYGYLFQTAGTWDIDQSTFDNFKTTAYTVQIPTGSTITSFNDNTISNSAYGINSQVAYTAFDNIVVSAMVTTDILADDVKLEFANSNFAESNVGLATSGNIISTVHNDVANAYKVMSTTLSKSAVINDYDTLSDVQLISGTFTVDEASASDDFTIDSGAIVVHNTATTHTFDSLANLTVDGKFKSDGTITTSADYFDFYVPNEGQAWMNDTDVSSVDMGEHYLGGFNYSIGSGKNTTMGDFIIENAATDSSHNFTYVDFSNKASGVVAHWNVSQYTGSERVYFLIGNLTAAQDYEIYIDLSLENSTTADGSGDIFFSRTDLTYSHIYITWIASTPDITVFFWTGLGTGHAWDDETNWKGLHTGTWYDPDPGDYPKSNLDEANFNESASALYLVHGANSVITIGALTTTSGFTGTITFSIDLVIDSAGGKNGSLNHKAVATIDVNTSNEQINMDGNLYISSSATFTERAGTIVVQGAGTQEIRVQSANKLYQLTLDTSGTVAELFDNLTVYKILIGAGTTYKMDADTRGYELWTNFSDVAGCGFVSTSSGTLNLIGSSAGRQANITTADASPPPTNRWTMNIGSGNPLALTMDYATLSYYVMIQTRGVVDIDDSTFDQSSWRNIFFASGTTITSFTDNTLSNGHTAMGVSFGLTHTAFDNIVISSTSTADLNLEGTAQFEFVNSNFDMSKVTLVADSNIISKTHNDIANNYQIMATTLSKSTITNDWGTGDNIEVVSGVHILDENGEAETIKIDSGATLQVGKTVPDLAINLVFDDAVGAGFDSASAGTLIGSGSAGFGMVITSAGSPPGDYWNGNTQALTSITMDYTTLSYGSRVLTAGTWDVENCTFDNFDSTQYAVEIYTGATITAFNNNTISGSSYGLRVRVAHTSFNNIVATSTTTQIVAYNADLEFTNSNFDTSKTNLATTGNIISSTHNDVSNAYKIISTTLSKNTITNKHLSGDNIQLISGTYTINEASASNNFQVDSGAMLILNTAQTHTFDADANLTNSGILTAQGDITTSSGYFDFYNPGSIWLNNSTVSNADFNYYMGGFNFTVGRTANTTIADLTLEAPDIVGGDTDFNITFYDFSNKDSGIVWHLNATATSGTVKVCTVNLTNGETYRLYVDSVQERETVGSGDAWNFSYAGWSTKWFNLTWITSGPPPPTPPGPGQWDSWIVGWKYSKNWISNEVRFEAVSHYDHEPSWFIWDFGGQIYESASPNITHTFKWGLYTVEDVKLTIIFTDGNRYYAGPEPLILDNTLIIALIVLAVIMFAAVSVLHNRKSRRREELIMIETEGR